MRLHKFLALALLAVAPLAARAQNIITTVAGGGPANNTLATSASIGAPTAVIQDGLGHTYILDGDLCRVYRVDASGHLTVYAGNGTFGYSGDGGPATSAQLSFGSGLAVDAAGNLYISDTNNMVIRVVPATNTTLFGSSTTMTAGYIYTVAGNGSNGYSGDGTGPATSASLAFPYGVAVDSSGNLFIADTGNNRIRVVPGANTNLSGLTPGYIYTVAGDANQGYNQDQIAAVSAGLYFPQGVAVDGSGNLFIADTGDNRIRVVPGANTNLSGLTPGYIYTVAGDGTQGYNQDQIAAVSAELNKPDGVFVDPSGNLFIADTDNQRIRVVPGANTNLSGLTPGYIYTVAGDGTQGFNQDQIAAVSAELYNPNGVFVDPSGNLFIADIYNARIREVPAATANGMTGGDIYTVAGNGYISYSGDGGTPLGAQLADPTSVSTDPSGNLFIADTYNSVIRRVSAATSKIQTVAGNGMYGYAGDGGPAAGTNSPAELAQPEGAFVDQFGNIFIADIGNCVIREVLAATGNIVTVAGTGPDANGLHCSYLGDGGPATGPTSTAQLNFPNGVFVDRSGNLFLADTNNCVIRVVAASTSPIPVLPGVPSPRPGYIYTVAGTGTCSYLGDNGPASAATLEYPAGVFVDPSGNLFIADTSNDRIRVVAASTSPIPVLPGVPSPAPGNIYTVAGNGNSGYSPDGTSATSASLAFPTSIAIDSLGNLFIADLSNNVIREVPATTSGTMTQGSVYTVVGSGSYGYSGDAGPALNAELDNPIGIAAGPSGSLLIADSQNNVIRSVSGLLSAPWLSLSTLTPFVSQVGTPSAQTLTLTNSGTMPLTVNTLTLTGAADFTETDNCAGVALNPNATCSATVTYTPSVSGAETATLAIADTANSPQTVGLSGTGTTVTATLGSTSLAFGNQLVGTPSTPPQSVTLTNSGTAALTISKIAVVGANIGDFTETDNCGNSVAAGTGCTINVTFTPTATGSRSANITITDNAPGNPQSIGLSGTGTTLTVGLNPASLTFATTYVGVAAAAQTVTLTNNGNAALNITAIAVVGTNSGDFMQTNNCGSSVAAGAKCAISVTFTPSATGSRSASITIADNATGSPQTIGLTGAGIAVSLAMASSGSTTQTVTPGTTATYNLQLAATGGASTDQVIATIACTGAPSLATCSAAPSTVTATPATPGAFAVTVTTTGSSALIPGVQSAPQSGPKMQLPAALRTLPLAVLALLLTIAAMLAWVQIPAGRLRTLRVALSACLVLLPISSAMLLSGCAGGSGPSTSTPSTPAGTYTITVTATANGKSQSMPLTLVVQ